MKSVILAIVVSLLSISSAFAGSPALETSPAKEKSTNVIDSYVPPSFANIARSYWAMNVYNIEDDVMVDNFLKITECDLYRQFYGNEFEWKKIRDSTRAYLQKYKNSFPRRFEYVQPLYLDRYDFNLKGFAVMPDSVFVSTTRLEIGTMEDDEKCKDMYSKNLEGYPRGVELIIKQPFRLSFVRVNEDLAKEYLKMINEEKINQKDGRLAYIRFRVRFDQYVGESYSNQKTYGDFAGTIETIEVFADRDMMFKIYEQAFY